MKKMILNIMVTTGIALVVLALVGMTVAIFSVCVCLDTLSLIDEVKTINGLI